MVIKLARISVRIPGSWKKSLREKGISISEITRSALRSALNQTNLPQNSGKMRSKVEAVKAFNGLSRIAVRTDNHFYPGFFEEMKDSFIKLPVFRRKVMEIRYNATPDELRSLADFCEQGEYAEEILNEVYK
jgi:hypothetical protein